MKGIIDRLLFNGSNVVRMERVEAETKECELVGRNPAEPSRHYSAAIDSTLAHIQSALTSEDVWPGEVVIALYPAVFDVQLVGTHCWYLLHGPFWAHYREELLRLGLGVTTVEELWRDRLGLTTTSWVPSHDGGDGCDDDHDTLNSELLLDIEYIDPEKSKRSGPSETDTQTLSPQRRVVAIRPTEQED